MHCFIRFTAVLAVAAASFGAQAQQPSGREMMLGRRSVYALMPDIKAELKLTEAQYKRMIDAFEGALTVDGDRIMMMLHGGEDLEAMEKAALKVLDAPQTLRLTECWLQTVGAIAAADPAIAKQLGLSAKQNTDIDKVLEQGWEDLQSIFSGGMHDETVQKAAEESRKATAKKVLSLLNEDQRKTFERLKGVPMKKKGKPQAST